ncbi:hypothetical protein SAFG77S_09049 [Streptomyces afghaniensis]
MGFVIYLSTSRMTNDKKVVDSNSYGYWQGKHYTVQGEDYPITDKEITEETKVYKSKVRAEKSAENASLRFGYVVDWKVEEK